MKPDNEPVDKFTDTVSYYVIMMVFIPEYHVIKIDRWFYRTSEDVSLLSRGCVLY